MRHWFPCPVKPLLSGSCIQYLVSEFMAKQLSHDNKPTNKPWDAVMHPTINIETFLFYLSVLKPAVFGLLVILSSVLLTVDFL